MGYNNFKYYDNIIFDFDGVIKDSNNIKTEAFRGIYKNYDKDIINKIVQYHIENIGLSRYAKFKYIEENILGNKYNDIIEKKLSILFSEIVFNKILGANYIVGVIDFIKFLRKYDKRLFVASAAPEIELKKIIKAIEIDNYFTEIIGSPTKKVAAIKNIMLKYPNSKTLFFGDALSDYLAAKNAECDFIGISSNRQEFESSVEVYEDFSKIL